MRTRGLTLNEPLDSSAAERDRRDLAERLYAEACALPTEARSRFIAEASGANDELRAELDSLIEHADAAEAFFGRLAEVMIPPELPPSGTIGRYEILTCIGVGGMGAVYRARDTRLHRDVALKFLPAHLGSALNAEERLLMEARAAAGLEHANVCTVHEIAETEDGRPFIAMAFYEGETLKQRLLRGPLPAAEAVDIAVQIVRGLGAAHAHGIVHRDVKPGNIMVLPGGTVKLLDFGLAKVADASITRPGITPGTVAYMSPEQARGDPVDARSDLWSVGVVLYEMLTGVRPFRGGNDRAVIQAILHSAPEPLRKHEPDTHRALQRILARVLQKQPEARYRSAAELLAELELVVASKAGAATSLRPSAWWTRRRALMAAVAGVMVLLGGATVWLRGRAPTGVTTSPVSAAAIVPGDAREIGAKTLAVLPFTNLSRDPEEDYFSDGLTEELIGVLSRVRALRVAARTSAFAFKGENRDIREIGRALNVRAVLEGSVRKDGDRVRVSAQLVNVEDGFPVWSESYDRELTDIFAIQRDLAVNIAAALEAKLTPAERERLGRRPTTSPEAFALYLKGRHLWNQRTRPGYDRAIEYFERAIAVDPQFASAHAGLAAVYSQQGMSGALAPQEARERMRASALRALELDDGLAEAHAVLGAYFHVYEWDSAAAEREQLRAIELDPSYAAARHYYGNFLRSMGRLGEAVAQQTLAVELDPLAPYLSETLAFTLLRAGRLHEAHEHLRNALELDSTYWRAHAALAAVYEEMDRLEDAVRTFERANELAGATTHRTKADIARVWARAGREDDARQVLAQLRAEATRTGLHEPAVATVFIALADIEGALRWLEHAYDERHPHLRFIGGDPRFARFEDEPQFMDLLRRVGLRH
jgi:TolB-like protein/Tfp pilus assembly protein PilF